MNENAKRFINFERQEITLKLAFQTHLLDFSEEFQIKLIELSKK